MLYNFVTKDIRAFMLASREVQIPRAPETMEFWPQLAEGTQWEIITAGPGNEMRVSMQIPDKVDGEPIKHSVAVKLRGHLPFPESKALEQPLDIKSGVQFRPNRVLEFQTTYNKKIKETYLKLQALRLVKREKRIVAKISAALMTEVSRDANVTKQFADNIKEGERVAVIHLCPDGSILCNLVLFERQAAAGPAGWKSLPLLEITPDVRKESYQTVNGANRHVRTRRQVQRDFLSIDDMPYRELNPAQTEHFASMLSNSHQLLQHLQEKVMPWTSKKMQGQKLDPNLMASVYYGVVQPGKPQAAHPSQPALQRISAPDNPLAAGLRQDPLSQYRMLGFREDLTPQQTEIFDRFIAENPSLKEFLDRPSVQAELHVNRVDKSLVEMALSAEIADTLARTVKEWRPRIALCGGRPHEQARSAISVVITDLAKYHATLMATNHVNVRNQDFFKTHLEKAYEKGLPANERNKRESFYKPLAVAVVAKREGYTGPIPADWKATDHYVDPVTGFEFQDYSFQTPRGGAVVSLVRGGSPDAAKRAVDALLDLDRPPLINDAKTRIKGVRLSELFYNELRSSCLHPHSIARAQFYTTFSMPEALKHCKGSMEQPTMEMVVEALKPCAIFRYTDNYCRVKPSEMVRVKYRTPTGENLNPCWDASQALDSLTEPLMKERHENTKWSLIMIEGEKKAAMLAQMMQDEKLPFHVIAIPGVWMAMKGPKGAKVLSEFFDPFVFQDEQGNQRKCLVFFDNDKAYNINVTQAMVETAACMQKRGAAVFIPNLPFGKKIKGADDFAQVHCRQENGINYRPLVEILDNAVYVPRNDYAIKAQNPHQQRSVKRYMQQAEEIHELQNSLRKQDDPLNSTDLRRLIVLQGAYLMMLSNERKILERFDQMDETSKRALAQRALTENPALQNLRRAMATHVPNFDTGTTLREVEQAGQVPQVETAKKRILITQELFSMA